MNRIAVALLGYAPDSDPLTNGVMTNASGVIPTLKGFKGAPSPAITPQASLPATCQGAALAFKLDNSTRLFAGAPTKLYEAGVSTWSDVSRAAAYTTGASARWRFAQQGNVSLATNGTDTMQGSVSTGAFSCIPGAPIANIIETVNAFVFALNTATSAQGWQCSANNDYTNWSTSIATQATSGTLIATPGPITAGRKFGSAIIAYKRSSMYFGSYVGAPVVWQFDQIPGQAGALSQEVVVNIGTDQNPRHMFMGESDFYIFDGAKPYSVGTNRVKETVFSTMLANRFYACTALHDRINSRVYFYYPVADSVFPDHCVVYNYRTDRWGVDDRQIEATVDYITPGITYGTLGNFYATYGSLPNLSYGTAFLSSAQVQPAIFGTDHKIRTLTGSSTTSSFTTGDYGDPSQFSTLTRVVPIFQRAPSSATLTNYYKNNEGDSLTQDAITTLMSGHFDVVRDARFHRHKWDMTGDWEMASFAAEYEDSGLE